MTAKTRVQMYRRISSISWLIATDLVRK